MFGAALGFPRGGNEPVAATHLTFSAAPGGASGTLARLERRRAMLVLHLSDASARGERVELSPAVAVPLRFAAELETGREVRLIRQDRPPGPSFRLEVREGGRPLAVLADQRGSRPLVVGGWRLQLAAHGGAQLASGSQTHALEPRARIGIEADGCTWVFELLAVSEPAPNPRGVSEDALRFTWVLLSTPRS